MIGFFRYISVLFMDDQKLAAEIAAMKAIAAMRELNSLRPGRAIKIISLFPEEKQIEICTWLGHQSVAGMLAAAPAKDKTIILNSLEQRLQRILIENMDHVKAAGLFDLMPSADRSFFLTNISQGAAGLILSVWPLKKQQEIINDFDPQGQVKIVACLETDSIKSIIKDWPRPKLTKLLQILSAGKLTKIFKTLDNKNQTEILNEIRPEVAANIISSLDNDEAATIMARLELPKAIAVLNKVTDFTCANIFNNLGQFRQEEMLPEIKEDGLLFIVKTNPPEKQVQYLQAVTQTKARAVFAELELTEIMAIFQRLDPISFLEVSSLLAKEVQVEVMKASPPGQIARVLECLDEEAQATFISIWDVNGQSKIIKKMADDAAAQLIACCPLENRPELLKNLDDQQAANILILWNMDQLLSLFEVFNPIDELVAILRLWPPDQLEKMVNRIEDPGLKEQIEQCL